MIKVDPVEKMPASRELDWIIAEKIMGVSKADFDAHWGSAHRYSSENVDALKVAERLKEQDGCEVHLTIHKKPFLYWCQIYWPRPREKWLDPKAKQNHSMRRKRLDNDDFKVWASYVETLPLAICRAALRYAEVRERNKHEQENAPRTTIGGC